LAKKQGHKREGSSGRAAKAIAKADKALDAAHAKVARRQAQLDAARSELAALEAGRANLQLGSPAAAANGRAAMPDTNADQMSDLEPVPVGDGKRPGPRRGTRAPASTTRPAPPAKPDQP
jgi:hypothetical protein